MRGRAHHWKCTNTRRNTNDAEPFSMRNADERGGGGELRAITIHLYKVVSSLKRPDAGNITRLFLLPPSSGIYHI